MRAVTLVSTAYTLPLPGIASSIGNSITDKIADEMTDKIAPRHVEKSRAAPTGTHQGMTEPELNLIIAGIHRKKTGSSGKPS